MKEQYNNTRRWSYYETALLTKKNAIRTDRKHSLTTPNTHLFFRALCLPSRVLLQVSKKTKGAEILFRIFFLFP
jgi:hypothetical protein